MPTAKSGVTDKKPAVQEGHRDILCSDSNEKTAMLILTSLSKGGKTLSTRKRRGNLVDSYIGSEPCKSSSSPVSSCEQKTKVKTIWTQEMDEKLIKLVDSEINGVKKCKRSHGSATSFSIEEGTVQDGSEKEYCCGYHLAEEGAKDCNWNSVASEFTRYHKVEVTSGQCWQRWYRYLNPSLNKFENRHKPWTAEEDEKLLSVVEKYKRKGQRRGIAWSDVNAAMQRPYVECRSRMRQIALKAQGLAMSEKTHA